MEQQVCHCCGQSVKYPEVLIDEGDRFINYKGVSSRLTSHEFTIAILLLRRPNFTFSKDKIFDEIYGLLPFCDWPDIKIVDVWICKIRKKLSGTGLIVKSHWGNGYSIILEPIPDNVNVSKQEAA